VQFVYIATRPTHFEVARELFEVTTPRVTNPDPGVEGLRYFTYRRHWENKEYAKLDAEQLEYLKDATDRYHDPRIEALYRPWLLGQIPVNAVTEEFRKLAPKRNMSFRTELVDGQTALFEPSSTNPKPRKETAPVKKALQPTFNPVFRFGFTDEPCETPEE
jgi:hypothetical protein